MHGFVLALLIAVLNTLCVSAALAQPIPPNMSEPRGEHTATLLPSGKVLIAGGNGASGVVANAGLYDWINNTWSTAGNLAAPRFLHTATRLPSGRVLVAGGTNGAVLDSVEIFDPSTNTWSAGPRLVMARYAHTATLLSDGRVLVVGGNTDNGATATAEIYDPAADGWRSVPGPAVARFSHTATLLASGKVLMAGGQFSGAFTGAVDVYDPATNAWTTGPALVTPRANHTATLLQDGSVLVVGGDFPAGIVRAPPERYDPARNAWIDASSANIVGPSLIKFHAIALLASGKALVTGGYTGTATRSVSQYDASRGSWAPAANLPDARWAHTATTLPNGRVLVAGGYNPDLGYLATLALYDPAIDSWTAQGSTLATDLDPTFGVRGMFVYPREPIGISYTTRQIVALSQGGLLAVGGIAKIVGFATPPNLSSASFKLTDAGALDTSFGQGGNLPDSLPIGQRFTSARELAGGNMALASEVIVCSTPPVCGTQDPGPTYRAQRYRQDGTRDSSYGGGEVDAESHLGNAAILADGTLIGLGGTYAQALLATGVVSRPFTFDAMVIDPGGQPDTELEAQFLDRMILCSPSGTAEPGNFALPMAEATPQDQIIFGFGGCMARLNRDATLDASFGAGGISQVDNAGLPIARVLLLKDGSTLTFSLLADGTSYRVVKRRATGLVDFDFGVAGVIARMDVPFTPVQASEPVAGVRNITNSRGFPALDSKDRVLIAGVKVDGATNQTITYLARFDARMNLDTSFGTMGTGLARISHGQSTLFTPYAAAIDSLGRILVGGQRENSDISLLAGVHPDKEVVARVNADSIVANVVEYYHAALDHYFITWKTDEIAKLDAGVEIKGWVRTGNAFNAYTSPQNGTVPVCRFYIPPGQGDSHFFGRDVAECDATRKKFPGFVLEDSTFMYMGLPNGGACPVNTTPIYRVFSNRADANHRYMTDRAIRDEMAARNWLAEGDGPDLTVMCAPR